MGVDHLYGSYACAYCGEANEVHVDGGGSAHQQYVEDCTVCCRPNLLSLEIDLTDGVVFVGAVRES